VWGALTPSPSFRFSIFNFHAGCLSMKTRAKRPANGKSEERSFAAPRACQTAAGRQKAWGFAQDDTVEREARKKDNGNGKRNSRSLVGDKAASVGRTA
jgi:hypothetical protein